MFRIKNTVRTRIQKSFGKNPLEGAWYYNASERMEDVRRYHSSMQEQNTDNIEEILDEVTWEDLEMDEVFLRINHTNSFIGEQYLYHRLHGIKGEKEENAVKTEDRLRYLEENEDLRVHYEAKLLQVGKRTNAYYLAEFLQNTDLWKIGNNYIFHVLQLLLLVFLVGALVTNQLFVKAGLFLVSVINLVIYTNVKMKFEVYIQALNDFILVLDTANWFYKNDKQTLFTDRKVKEALESLKSLSGRMNLFIGKKQSAMTGDAFAILADYLWGITLLDISLFNYIMKKICNKQDAVFTILKYVGEIDSDIAILSFRKSQDIWCSPEFVSKGIETVGIGHPLLESPVRNDFSLTDRAIITGANASGKSTFMKSLAINVILGQTIHTCTAVSMRLGRMNIMTCMSLRDDILSGESYYFREAKYIKRMIDCIDTGNPILCVIDEILKGTNTKERIAASRAILDYIVNENSLILVATHDMELTETEVYKKYHFESVIENDDIYFDYKIHNGNSTASNAIALLELLHYPKYITEQARKNIVEQ